jgi:hypothetical protein
MIAEHCEPKGLAKNAEPIGCFTAEAEFRQRAERGSAMLRNALLTAMGLPEKPEKPKPLKKVELCPTCLGPIMPPPRRIAAIQHVVATYYSLSPESMTGNARRYEISRARQVAMYLACELTHHSIAEVGRRFKKDHTTVLHALKAVKARAEKNDQLAFDISLLRERLS